MRGRNYEINPLPFLWLVLNIAVSSGFNIETRDVTTVPLPGYQKGSWLGQSIALDSDPEGQLMTYLSAPLYKSDGNFTGVTSPDGAIYKCSSEANRSRAVTCVQRSFDPGSRTGMTMAMIDKDLLVCSPQWTYLCRKANLPLRMVGKCYVLNNTEDFENSKPQVLDSPYVRDCPGELDVILLLDGSGSIVEKDFYIAKLWLVDFLKSYREGLNSGEVHIGLIQYSGYTEESSCDMGNLTRRLKVEMPLGSYNLTEASEIVLGVKSLGHCTLTGDAINISTEHFINHGRQDNVAVMIVVTDGVSNDSVSDAANHARENGITVIAVGVGNDVDMQQLDEIADSGQYKFNVSKYESLSGILGELQEAIIAAEGSFLERIASNFSGRINQYMVGMSAVTTKDNVVYEGAIGAIGGGMGSVISRNVYNLSHSQTLSKEALLLLIRKSLAGYTAEDNYLAYAMASGFFFGSEEEYVAVAMPRFRGYGAVLLFPVGISEDKITTSAMINTTIVTSAEPQIGSYFGHSLAAIDVNNDGFDDMLVGAPLYIDSGLEHFDEGSVTIFFGKSASVPNLKQNCILVGVDSNSRLGSFIAPAGDLDRDGFQDFAVGAPAHNNNQGEVVVYYGNTDCPSRYQRITGKTSDSDRPYFGYSIAVKSLQNGPVLLVSSPNVGSVSIFRPRPVVDVIASLDIQDGGDHDVLVMDPVKCVRNQRNGKACVSLKACFELTWRDPRQSTVDGTLELSYKISLESDMKNRRFMFVSNKGQIFKSDIIVGTCQICVIKDLILRIGILSKADGVDLAVPAVVTLLTMISDNVDNVAMSPILPMPQVKLQKFINFTKGCAISNACSYDLMLTTIRGLQNPIYLYEANEIVTIGLQLTNLKDPTFFTKVIVTSTKGSITKLISNCSFLEDDRRTISYNDDVTGSLMLQNTTCRMDISITLRHFSRFANDTNFEISIRALSLMDDDDNESSDVTPENNVIKMVGDVKYATVFDIKGVSEPFDVQYWRNVSAFGTTDLLMDDELFGEENVDISHRYQVLNTGAFTVYDTSLQFTWPAFISTTKKFPILYLHEFSCLPLSACSCNIQDICGALNPFQLAPNSANSTYASLCQSLWDDTRNVSITEYEAVTTHPFTSTKIGCDVRNASIICSDIRCNISRLPSQNSVTIKAKMRMWTPTFKLPKESPVVHLESSVMLDQRNGLNFPDIIMRESIVTTTQQYFTVATPVPVKPLNALLILISMMIGLIVILILMCVCWKCGFFKSKYRLELERRKAMVLTEEEIELENSLPRSIKSGKRCLRSTVSSSSSCSDNDIVFFMMTNPSSSAEGSDEIDELYLEMTPLQKCATRLRVNRRKEKFKEEMLGHSISTAEQSAGMLSDDDRAQVSLQPMSPSVTVTTDDRSESPDYSYIESTMQEDGKRIKRTVSLKRKSVAESNTSKSQ